MRKISGNLKTFLNNYKRGSFYRMKLRTLKMALFFLPSENWELQTDLPIRLNI